MANKKPLFSIVTVCYNSAKTIERTLKSMDEQSFTDYEHLIIDGKSTDSTLELILSAENVRRNVMSERDSGIFDAMNKGIEKACGDYICFLNSDDTFYNQDSLQKVANLTQGSPEIVYGNTEIVDDGNKPFVIGKQIAKEDYYFGTPIIHQAVFVRKDIFNRYGLFDLSLGGGAADWIWLANYFLSKHGTTEYLNSTIIKFYRGGASNRYVWENYLERIRFSWRMHPKIVFTGYLIQFPVVFIKFKVLKLHQDTTFRRTLRVLKSKIRSLI